MLRGQSMQKEKFKLVKYVLKSVILGYIYNIYDDKHLHVFDSVYVCIIIHIYFRWNNNIL